MSHSDWKQSAVDRSDFRRSKTKPEIPKKKAKKKRKNNFKLVVKDFTYWFTDQKGDYILGKYKTKESAKQALNNQKHDLYFKKFNLVIEEIK